MKNDSIFQVMLNLFQHPGNPKQVRDDSLLFILFKNSYNLPIQTTG